MNVFCFLSPHSLVWNVWVSNICIFYIHPFQLCSVDYLYTRLCMWKDLLKDKMKRRGSQQMLILVIHNPILQHFCWERERFRERSIWCIFKILYLWYFVLTTNKWAVQITAEFVFVQQSVYPKKENEAHSHPG